MRARCRILAIGLAVLAGGVVFSPLAAALVVPAQQQTHTPMNLMAPLARAIVVAAVAALTAMALGFPFAIIVDRARPAVRKCCWGLGLVTLIVPPYIVAESAIVLFGPAGKISRGVALLCGFGPNSRDATARARFAVPGFVYTPVCAGILLGGCLFAIVALAVGGANRRTDRRIFESARLMRGRGGVARVAGRVLIPPAIGAALLVFAIAMTESVLPQLLRVQTIGEAIYERIQEGDLSAAATMSVPLLPLIMLAGGAGAFILVRARAASLAGLEGDVPKFTGEPSTRRDDFFALLATAPAIVPGVIVPVVGLGWLMFTAKLPVATAGEHQLLRASGFADSLRGAWDLARDDAVRTAILATLTATFAVVFAILLVRPIIRTRWSAALGVLGAGLIVPAPIVGLGLIVLWNRGAGNVVYESPAIVVLAWLARFLPVGVLLSQAALVRVPLELEHAAALAGRGAIGRFTAVVLPSAAPGLAAAWLAVYVLCATEFAATLLVAPPGAPMLAPSVVNLMRRGQDPEIAACQVLLLAVVLAPLIVLAIVVAVRGRRKVAV